MQTPAQYPERSGTRGLLLLRQERLGIIANPVPVTLPALPPRDVWTRWPRLRSARRRERLRDDPPQNRLDRDPVLNGKRLEAFAAEIRSARKADDMAAQVFPHLVAGAPTGAGLRPDFRSAQTRAWGAFPTLRTIAGLIDRITGRAPAEK